MIKIGITGSSGFIGNYLYNFLSAFESVWVVRIKRIDKGFDETEVKDCDVVVHCAGVNRPDTENTLEDNVTVAVDLVKKARDNTKIFYLSTTQINSNNEYGFMKKKAEELFLQKNDKNRVLRLPNVYGAGCRPNYNSVVATFCNQSVAGLPHSINNPEAPLCLLWVGDLARTIWGLITSSSGGSRVIEEFDDVCHTTVGDISRRIIESHRNITSGVSSATEFGFSWKIESTLLSYFETNHSRTLDPHIDYRGSFTELLKTPTGQLSVLECGVGQERGMHFHLAKFERFYVLKGEAVFRSQKITGGPVSELYVSAKDSKEIFTSPLYTHSIKNVGEQVLIVAIWANENFRKDAPDTIARGYE